MKEKEKQIENHKALIESHQRATKELESTEGPLNVTFTIQIDVSSETYRYVKDLINLVPMMRTEAERKLHQLVLEGIQKGVKEGQPELSDFFTLRRKSRRSGRPQFPSLAGRQWCWVGHCPRG